MQSVNASRSDCEPTRPHLKVVWLALCFESFAGVNAMRTTCSNLHTQRHYPALTCGRYVIINAALNGVKIAKYC